VSNPVYLCPSLTGDTVVLDGPEGRHAATVKRTRVGEVVDLVDGRGTRVTGPVTAVTKDTLTVAVETRTTEPPPSPRLTLVQALAKGVRGELAVELATEVGVDEVLPWSASRCVVRWDGERGAKGLERWRATARGAAKQARRAWVPEVGEPLTTAQVAALPGTVLVLHESAAAQLTAVPLLGTRLVEVSDASSAPGSVTGIDKAGIVLVVGPEGGVSDEELEVLTAAGATAVRLGATVLRTSTAGAAALAVVSARTGRW
jgi:16S rRNA (uracil1498-N3)-methyltransferase